MLTQEDDVEIHALARRGWSVSAIARHTGRDRKTVRKYLASPRAVREPAASCLEPFRAYLEARFVDDAHVLGSVLYQELVGLGFCRSYPTLVRELRRLELRPVCECCRAGGVKLTVELEHEPGEELQIDWLELSQTPWGCKAYVLVGALSHSGRLRGCFSDGESFPHLAEALDGVEPLSRNAPNLRTRPGRSQRRDSTSRIGGPERKSGRSDASRSARILPSRSGRRLRRRRLG